MQRHVERVLLVGCVVLGPGWACADEVARPTPGSHVRVELAGGGRALTGRLVKLDGEALTLATDGESQAIPRDQIRRVEVSGGRPSRWRRAAVGAGIGAASGIPAAAFTGEWHITGPLALFGALIGFSLPSHERWNAVDIRGVEVRCAPSPGGGPGIAVSLSF
jgi:hypothetical protein